MEIGRKKGFILSEFHPAGMIHTIHGLYEILDPKEYLESLDERLTSYGRDTGIGLILPCLLEDARRAPVMGRILSELANIHYLRAIVVPLGGASCASEVASVREEFRRALDNGADLRVIWVDAPSIEEICRSIDGDLVLQDSKGKGKSVWLAMGYLLARGDCEVLAVHDTDVLTYDRILLGRLIEPTAHPEHGFDFCKGFYARISPTELAMKGRVTRLFVIPFVDAMHRHFHGHGNRELGRFFRFFRDLRYPLSGEWSLRRRLAEQLRLAPGWTLEVKVLGEVYNRIPPDKMVQVDLARNYEHKHQPVEVPGRNGGLKRMVVEISRFFLEHMIDDGSPLDDVSVREIQSLYGANAIALVERYSKESLFNHLTYEREGELQTVQRFSEALWMAWEGIKDGGPDVPKELPCWGDLFSRHNGLTTQLLEAVDFQMGW